MMEYECYEIESRKSLKILKSFKEAKLFLTEKFVEYRNDNIDCHLHVRNTMLTVFDGKKPSLAIIQFFNICKAEKGFKVNGYSEKAFHTDCDKCTESYRTVKVHSIVCKLCKHFDIADKEAEVVYCKETV